MDSLSLKRHSSSQNENNKNDRKVTPSFFSTPLVFKSQNEFLKFTDTCVSWSSPKNNLETNFLNLENRSFESLSFDIHLHMN